MTTPVLSAESLCKSFNGHQVLQDASLQLQRGQVHGLIGLNGAGKTTLIRILLGLLTPDSGTSTINELSSRHAPQAFYRQVGVVLENNGFFPTLSIRTNLHFYARARGLSSADADQYVEEYWHDTSISDTSRKARDLSRGQKMQCALCRAFLGWPTVYLLDEPVVALDMTAYDHFCDLVRTARGKGATVLISSHQLDAIEELCDSASILENGTLHELAIPHHGEQGASQLWRLRAPDTEAIAALITEIVGSSAAPRYSDQFWRFAVDGEAEQIVPMLVNRLVQAGVAVCEIAPERADLRTSLRQHYRKEHP